LQGLRLVGWLLDRHRSAPALARRTTVGALAFAWILVVSVTLFAALAGWPLIRL
jgi:hypothetical protein